MEYKIADLNLKKVNLISGDYNKQDGYLKKGISQISQRIYG